jgi:hypothetical protein
MPWTQKKTTTFVLLNGTSSVIGTQPESIVSEVDKEALIILVRNDLQQLDQILPPMDDPIQYTVMNMILVEQASAFSTCCSERSPQKVL